MATLIHHCTTCEAFTMETKACPHCGGKVEQTKPPKYSPEDHYGEYRRKLKLREAQKNN